MTVRVVCGHCAREFLIAQEYAGKTIRCPRCRKPITVPGAAPAPKPPAPPSPAATVQPPAPLPPSATAPPPAPLPPSSVASLLDEWDQMTGADPAGSGQTASLPAFDLAPLRPVARRRQRVRLRLDWGGFLKRLVFSPVSLALLVASVGLVVYLGLRRSPADAIVWAQLCCFAGVAMAFAGVIWHWRIVSKRATRSEIFMIFIVPLYSFFWSIAHWEWLWRSFLFRMTGAAMAVGFGMCWEWHEDHRRDEIIAGRVRVAAPPPAPQPNVPRNREQPVPFNLVPARDDAPRARRQPPPAKTAPRWVAIVRIQILGYPAEGDPLTIVREAFSGLPWADAGSVTIDREKNDIVVGVRVMRVNTVPVEAYLEQRGFRTGTVTVLQLPPPGVSAPSRPADGAARGAQASPAPTQAAPRLAGVVRFRILGYPAQGDPQTLAREAVSGIAWADPASVTIDRDKNEVVIGRRGMSLNTAVAKASLEQRGFRIGGVSVQRLPPPGVLVPSPPKP
jgi:DNA-directed RNA polymerase subunit RPC12/RpoP